MPSDSFQLRSARPEDVPAITGLIHELAAYERAPDECRADAGRLREHLFGSRPCVEAIVAERGEVVIAFALFFHNYSTWLTRPGLYLEDLFVKPEARGLGIGKALLVRLAEIAVARDCGRMEWSVLEWNEPAIGFYRSLGAVSMDEWRTHRLHGEALRALGTPEGKTGSRDGEGGSKR